MKRKKYVLLSLVMMLTIMLVACGDSREIIAENTSSDMKTETENETDINVLEENNSEDIVEDIEDIAETEDTEDTENA